ncbi:MAG: sigma 54-interacting transcriptional regulator [Deferribacteres bacterium]|nr:sigma 54-interacting transcriptional regulator [candidate division KSB1 bacterium]MCB9510700.1 sigma 54-interacting transcriptional regulator [Deferribacteres bacterium]
MKLVIYTFPNRSNSALLPENLAESKQLPKTLADIGVLEALPVPHNSALQLLLVAEKVPTSAQVRSYISAQNSDDSASDSSARYDRQALHYILEMASGALTDAMSNNLFERLQERYAQAREAGWVGPVLQYIFQRCVWLHEKSRMETDLFKFAIHEHSVLRELAQKIFGQLNRTSTGIAGCPPESAAFLMELQSHGCKNIMLFHDPSAETDRIDPLGQFQHFEKEAFSFTHGDLLLVFDPEYAQLFEGRKLKQQLAKRQSKALLIFDWTNALPVPKNSNLYFYSRADLAAIIEHNLHARKHAAETIQTWIASEIDDFYKWLTSDNRNQFAGIIGATKAMQNIFELISRIARTNITVLIDGESGTGKELVARAVHRFSARSEQPFIAVNCGAIPENLLESELFGHVRGAFTGAVAEKPGLFEQAQHGTIFLDEIAELAPHLQVKLLRFLQEGEIRRVGSNHTIRLDVRMLAATNKNLADLVAQNTFRSDLYYRLNVMQLTLPALRERRQDIPLLANQFLKRFAQKFQKNVHEISEEAMTALLAYHWPGNIRELENAIEHATALAIGKNISPFDLPANITRKEKTNGRMPSFGRVSLRELEKQYIIETLEEFDWDYEFVCKQLGIGRTTLWRKLKEYKINK